MKMYCNLCVLSIILFSCIRKGAESKDVKFLSHNFYPAVYVGDTSFFLVNYQNKSNVVLRSPFIRLAVKDTSSKLFHKTLYSDSKNLGDIPANSSFSIRFDVFNNIDFNKVAKIKFYLSWTNSNDNKSIRRSVKYN